MAMGLIAMTLFVGITYVGQLITVVVPEFAPESVRGHLLHNQTANILRVRLLGIEDVVLIDVPYHVHKRG